jgi:hypothetical protein
MAFWMTAITISMRPNYCLRPDLADITIHLFLSMILPFSESCCFEMDDLKPYSYTDLKQKEIRIIHLYPGEPTDTVFIEISHEKLIDGIPDYHALSWEWGLEPATASIRIKDKTSTDSEVRTMKVKPNLAAALKHLRLNKIRRLWVDAICIDQIEQGTSSTNTTREVDIRKNQEKSDQISRMSDIYGMAQMVCVWLGEAKHESADAIQLIRRLGDLEDFDGLATLEKFASELQALIRLLKRGWFSRRWVVQVSSCSNHLSVILLTCSLGDRISSRCYSLLRQRRNQLG